MECILADLALEVQPNFESPAYAGWLNATVNGGPTREEALTHMREQEEQERTAKEAEVAEEQWEAEKKPKINNFYAGVVVTDVLIPCPSQYALQKIKSMEYVELWYFSPEGCQEAADSSRSTAEDSFGLVKVDGYVAFKPIAAFKASHKALQDHDLPWHQFDMAKTSFLVHINKCGWLDKHQQALALFFTLITNHEHRIRPRGKKTLL
ncbi:uncharacterized protein BJ212DRAFT_1302695 [Suillus subaureus]|uniref:Uncharacterized protein n=1 Tax=Suillus subaureus TaxID=48587 RepID=A0A9P7E1U7_9AGAM|nr:uncharacterized protein BJ212DRAFT_1302695 [Suillus subaureus]KAG1809128.1 hypothetical protein BJ212DRAFT_1302695 [Suillus subaureus]